MDCSCKAKAFEVNSHLVFPFAVFISLVDYSQLQIYKGLSDTFYLKNLQHYQTLIFFLFLVFKFLLPESITIYSYLQSTYSLLTIFSVINCAYNCG